MSVFEQVVTGFDTDNTLLLMKCSKEDMLEGMMLLPMGVSLLLKKCDKEDMLEGIVLLLLMGVALLLLKCGKDGVPEGKLLLRLGMSLLLMNHGNVMADNKVMAPIGTSMTYRKE